MRGAATLSSLQLWSRLEEDGGGMVRRERGDWFAPRRSLRVVVVVVE